MYHRSPASSCHASAGYPTTCGRWCTGGRLFRQQPQDGQPRSHRRRRATGATQVWAALFDPPPFSPQKLRVEYLPGGTESHLAARRYTLTHNDITGALMLSIGRDYNHRQLAGWYTRAVRDEVLAEWVPAPAGNAGRGTARPSASAAAAPEPPPPRLHVYCHVSGEELWPAPPSLRSFIFQREMTLVLDTIAYAERALLEAQPHLRTAPIWLHLRSHLPGLNSVLDWGVLGDRASWPSAPSTLLRAMLGTPAAPAAAPVTAAAVAASSSRRGGVVEQQQQGQVAGVAAKAGAAPLMAALDQQQQQTRQEQQQRRRWQDGAALPAAQQQQPQRWRREEAAPSLWQQPGLAAPPPPREPALGRPAPAVAAAAVVGTGLAGRRAGRGSASSSAKQAAVHNGVPLSHSRVAVVVAADGVSLGGTAAAVLSQAAEPDGCFGAVPLPAPAEVVLVDSSGSMRH